MFIRHPSMDTWVASTLLAAVSNAAVNMGVHVSLCALLPIILGAYPEVGLLDPMAVLFLILGGNSVLFSTMVVPIYTPTNRVQAFQFLHILANVCYFLERYIYYYIKKYILHPNRCEAVPFDF